MLHQSSLKASESADMADESIADTALREALAGSREGYDPTPHLARIRQAGRDLGLIESGECATAWSRYIAASVALEQSDFIDGMVDRVPLAAQDEAEKVLLASLVAGPLGVAAKLAVANRWSDGRLLTRELAEAIVSGGEDASPEEAIVARAYLDCLALARPPKVASDRAWAALVEEVRAAVTAYDAVIRFGDAIELGREPTAEEDAMVAAASQRELRAIDALIAFQPADVQTAAAKAALLDEQRIGEALDGAVLAEAFTRDLRALVQQPQRTGGTDFIAAAWNEAAEAVARARASDARAHAAFDAAPDDLAVAEAFDDTIDALALEESRLIDLPAPDLAAVAAKIAIHLPYVDGKFGTLDDHLHRMIADGDGDTREVAMIFLDVERLARLQGVDTPFYPRSFNGRLGRLGCTVSPKGFATPDGLTGPAFALIGELDERRVYELMAAAWIDAFLEAKGEIRLLRGAPYFDSAPVGADTASAARRTELSALLAKEGDPRLRLAVVPQVLERLKALRTDRLGPASEDQPEELAA